MNDHDIEDRLRQFQPAGPPSELRARVAGVSRETRQAGRRWIEWVPAAAAVLAAVMFYTLSAGARRDIAVRLQAADTDRASAVSSLTDALGGGDYARDEAARLIDSTPPPAADFLEGLVSHHE